MDDEMTQDDIDALMSLGADEVDEPDIKPYDFTTPAPIPAEHKKTVTLIHETYSQALAMSLSSLLRAEVTVSLEKVDQDAFSQYAMSLVNPTCIATFDMQPLNGYGIIEVNSALMYSVINRMLGGGIEVPKIGRAFTEIELSVVRKVISLFLRELSNAWAYILKINYDLKETQTNPAFVRIIPMRELCLVITLKLKAGDTTGLATICIPYSNLEPIASKLGNQQWQRYSVKQSEEIQDAHRRNFYAVELDVEAILGHLDLSFAEVLALQKGDILDLGQRTKKPITLRLAGQDKYECNPGLVGKYKGVAIHKEIVKE